MSRPGLDGLTKGLWANLARIPGDVMASLRACFKERGPFTIFKVYGHLAFAPFISSLYCVCGADVKQHAGHKPELLQRAPSGSSSSDALYGTYQEVRERKKRASSKEGHSKRLRDYRRGPENNNNNKFHIHVSAYIRRNVWKITADKYGGMLMMNVDVEKEECGLARRAGHVASQLTLCAVTSALSCLLVMPLKTILARMVLHPDLYRNGERGEVLSTFKQILRDESGWGFYEGLGLNFAVNFILYSLSTCK